jgi:hypothetical protein
MMISEKRRTAYFILLSVPFAASFAPLREKKQVVLFFTPGKQRFHAESANGLLELFSLRDLRYA